MGARLLCPVTSEIQFARRRDDLRKQLIADGRTILFRLYDNKINFSVIDLLS